jgi:hypothetical protein
LKETRSYRLQGKRFTGSDLRSLVRIFTEIASELGETLGEDIHLVFRLSTADDITYESSDGRHFEEGEAVDLKSITSISLGLDTFNPRCSIELDLAHGDSKYSNKLKISSEDSGWVHKPLAGSKRESRRLNLQNRGLPYTLDSCFTCRRWDLAR